MSERILIDTGPIVAIFSPDDQQHDRCCDALDTLTAPFLTCWPVITEAAYLSRRRPESLARMLDGFAGGLFALASLNVDDLAAIAALLKRYESAGSQLADVALAQLAERENIQTVFTLDRRDFSIIRLKQNRSLRLIPEMN